MRSKVVLVLLFGIAVAGCRTYGDGMSREALTSAIGREAVTLSAVRDEVRLGADALQALSEEADGLTSLSDRMSVLAEDYDKLVDVHSERVVEAQASGGFLRENPLVAWVGNDRYRELHRTYGTMIAERGALADRYAVLLNDLRAQISGTSPPTPQEVGRYQIAPQFYRRLHEASWHQELSDILAGLESVTQ